jgi:adenylylsulfate kinase
MKTTNDDRNIVWHNGTISRACRANLVGHKSIVLWFTGLSGCGKSTTAYALEKRLYQDNYHAFVLDGDNIRHGLCDDLDFSDTGREENIRRVSEVSKLFIDAGIIILAAFISPFKSDRDKIREIVGPENFVEVYCRCSIKECTKRDVKGLYRRAIKGEIENFTGISSSSPYEEPLNPEIVIDTANNSLGKNIEQIVDFLAQRGIYEQKNYESYMYTSDYYRSNVVHC